MKPAVLVAAFAIPFLAVGTAHADEQWLPPNKTQCSLEPGQDCGADVTCPTNKAYVVNGGGGIPKVSDENHRLAITMNVAINPNTWRVRWRNMGTKKIDVTVMVRVMCTDDGDDWGK